MFEPGAHIQYNIGANIIMRHIYDEMKRHHLWKSVGRRVRL